jgi:uncharacterized protein YrrD
MNAQPETVNSDGAIDRSDLMNRLVIDSQTTEEVGRVEQLWLDIKTHKVVGITCKSGLIGRQKRSFTWGQIQTIGKDSLLVNTPEGAQLEKLESWESPIGHELWTDAGNKAGSVVDVRFLPDTGDVVEYIFTASGWRRLKDGTYRLSKSAIVSIGSKRAIAVDAAVQAAQQHATGLSTAIDRAAEFIKEDYEKTRQDLSSLQQNAQSIAEKVQKKVEPEKPEASKREQEVRTTDD